MNNKIDLSEKTENIIKEVKNIINNDINDESKLRQMFGQLLIDDMKSTINKWDNLEIPLSNYKNRLYKIFEELFKIFIPEKLENYKYLNKNYKYLNYSDIVEFRNKAWGDRLVFSIPGKINAMYILDKNNIMYKRELINNKITLETTNLSIPFSFYLNSFIMNEISIKKIINLILEDIEKYIDEKINILHDKTLIDLSEFELRCNIEKPIKIGLDDCFLMESDISLLSLYIKIGVGMIGE